MLIKICGINNIDIAEQSAQLGANYIGMVFDVKSSRYVNTELAQQISKIAKNNGAVPVAVVTEMDAAEIVRLCKKIDVQVVQLHGRYSRAEHVLLPKKFKKIYVIPVLQNGLFEEHAILHGDHLNPESDFILYDHATPGGGISFPWAGFAPVNALPFFVAGGLNAKNVTSAINELHPQGVDVSSAVESSKGKKDKKLISEFIQAVRST